MKVIMRLYRQHDLDLIYLYKHQNFSLQNAVKSAISAACNNKYTPFIEIPANDHQPESLMLPKQVQFHVYLSEKDDENTIKWILGITKGYRNNVLKNLIRHYITTPVLTPFISDTSLLFQSQTNSSIQKEVLDSPTRDRDNLMDIADEVLHTPISNSPSPPNMEFKEASDVLKADFKTHDDSESAADMFDALISSFDNV